MKTLDELQATLSEKAPKFLAITILGSPDPDAIASAFALQSICSQLDITSKVYAEKPISHPNNQTLVNFLDLTLHSFKELASIESPVRYAIVDYQFRDLGPEFPEAECLVHIDHHKESPSAAAYVDIDRKVGSCSTIFTHYVREYLKDNKESGQIALALAYGVYTDTKRLQRATSVDFEALSILRGYYDPDAFESLCNVKYSTQTMTIIKKCMENAKQVGTFCYSGVGHISEDYRDSLAIAADFLLGQAGVTYVLVYGVIKDQNYVNGCFRTSDSSSDTDKFVKSFVVKGSGGGRKEAGGFQEPLGLLEECPDESKQWDMVNLIVETKISRKVTAISAEEQNS